MRAHAYFLAAACSLALVACHSDQSRRSDSDSDSDSDGGRVSAEGKAEEGKISINSPGFNLSLSLPKEMARQVRADRGNKIIYPGASMIGIAVAAGKGGDRSGESEVEIRFRTPVPLEDVAAWYRDPARAEGFRLQGVAREGGATVIQGIQNSDRRPFRVRLAGEAGGGTDGRLTIRHTS
jgi:hypothetical protein